MIITSDVSLKGDIWNDVLGKLKPIVSTNYGVYILATSIGIYNDKQIENLPATLTADAYHSVPRTILLNNTQMLDILFKSAIITTNLVGMNEDKRMELAFNDDSKIEFNRMGFLTKFANYGIKQLAEKLSGDTLENIENIKKYISDSAIGIDLDSIDLSEFDIDEDDIKL